MNNREFIIIVKNSFKVFLNTSSRSNEKLKVLHKAIAEDVRERLICAGKECEVFSLGLDGAYGREANIRGRYIDKKVDITIKKNDRPIAGIGIKFVMQNYSQNSNNYFENMLGETANIRCANIPYFQIFIIPEKLPYYNKNGKFQHWETLDAHHLRKYHTLSKDDPSLFFHTPVKMLLFVVKLPETRDPENRADYQALNESSLEDSVSESAADYGTFDSTVVLNDYETFIQKVVHYICSI